MDGCRYVDFLRTCCKLNSLVVFYPHQCHIGINVNYWCHHNLSTHDDVFYIFLCRTLTTFYKLLVIIVICNKKQTNWSNKHRNIKPQRITVKKSLLYWVHWNMNILRLRFFYVEINEPLNKLTPNFINGFTFESVSEKI